MSRILSSRDSIWTSGNTSVKDMAIPPATPEPLPFNIANRVLAIEFDPVRPADVGRQKRDRSDQPDDFPPDPEHSQQENNDPRKHGMAPQLYAADGWWRVRQVGERLDEL